MVGLDVRRDAVEIGSKSSERIRVSRRKTNTGSLIERKESGRSTTCFVDAQPTE